MNPQHAEKSTVRGRTDRAAALRRPSGVGDVQSGGEQFHLGRSADEASNPLPPQPLTKIMDCQ
jgi:hypothetical protein